jgi:uncharacterized phage protein (TIGR01671 family)
MSNRFKFRVWDGHEMRESPPLGEWDEADCRFFSGYNQKHILMQWTGCLDQKGKEIYEGDIVRIIKDRNQLVANAPYYEGLQFGDIGIVEWNPVNLRWSLCPVNNDDVTDMDYYTAWSEWNWLEVIGNIYESPDLVPHV